VGVVQTFGRRWNRAVWSCKKENHTTRSRVQKEPGEGTGKLSLTADEDGRSEGLLSGTEVTELLAPRRANRQ